MKKLTAIFFSVLLFTALLGSASVEAATKLATPKNFAGSAEITKQYETILTITWSKVDGADGYEVYYRSEVPGGDDEWEPWFLNEKTKKTTAQGMIIDGEFQMRVRAYKGSTYSDYTETITVRGGEGIISGPKASATPKLNKTKASIDVGKTVQLKVNNTKDKVTWKSSNKKVATVSSKGLVKGVKQGEATITATVGKKKLTCKITVKKSSKGTSSNILDSYREILNKNISSTRSFALLDINKDGQKELFLNVSESASSIDCDTIVYSYYNGKIYDSTVCGQIYPSYISSKKGIAVAGMFSSNEWVDIYVLEKGVLKSIYISGSHLKYDDKTGEFNTEVYVNNKTVSPKERAKSDEAAGIYGSKDIKFYEVTKENIDKYLK